MTDVLRLARERRARLIAELRRIEAFLATAEELLAAAAAAADSSAGAGAPTAGEAPEGRFAPPGDHFLYTPASSAPASDVAPGGKGASGSGGSGPRGPEAVASPDAKPRAVVDEASRADVLVGRRLRQRRWMMGLTQRQLARMIGVDARQIQHFEEGSVHISTSRLWHIAGALEVPMSYFYDDTAEAPPRRAAGASKAAASVVKLR